MLFVKKASEHSIEKKLVSGVKKLGGWALKFWPVSFTGFPDRIILLPGARIFFVETKAEGKTTKRGGRQNVVHAFLRKLGFIVYVINSRDRVTEILEHFKMLIENDL